MSRRYGNCLTASKQGACTAQPLRAARRLIEGNGRGEAVRSRRCGTRNRFTSQAYYAFFALCNMLKAASFFFFCTSICLQY